MTLGLTCTEESCKGTSDWTIFSVLISENGTLQELGRIDHPPLLIIEITKISKNQLCNTHQCIFACVRYCKTIEQAKMTNASSSFKDTYP